MENIGARYEDEISDAVWAALRECYDPEISVNIVDLGQEKTLHRLFSVCM